MPENGTRNDVAVERQKPAVARRAGVFFYLTADSALFAAAAYLCLRAALLRLEGQYTLTSAYDVFFFTAMFIFISRYAHERLFGGRMLAGLAAELFFLFAFVIAAALLSKSRASFFPAYALSYFLNRFPADVRYFAGLAPSAAIGFIAAYAVSVWVSAARLKFPRFTSRAALILAMALFYSLFSANVLPLAAKKCFSGARGVKKIADYAADVQPSPRDTPGVWLADPRTNTIIRITADGKKKEAVQLKGVSCDLLAADAENGTVYAADTKALKALLLSGDGSASGVSLKTDWGGVLRALLPMGDKFYALYDGRPGVAEFDARTGDQTGGIDFTRPRATAFRTGGRAFAWSAPADALFVLAGEADTDGKSLLLRIDPERFRANGMSILPDEAAAIAASPNAPSVYVAGSPKPLIYEIDLAAMAVKRVLPGPSAVRAIVFDPSRNVIFAAGWYDGRFEAVDVSNGRIIRSDFAGKRVTAIKLDAEFKYLYAVSSEGVFRIELKEYLKTLLSGQIIP